MHHETRKTQDRSFQDLTTSIDTSVVKAYDSELKRSGNVSKLNAMNLNIYKCKAKFSGRTDILRGSKLYFRHLFQMSQAEGWNYRSLPLVIREAVLKGEDQTFQL